MRRRGIRGARYFASTRCGASARARAAPGLRNDVADTSRPTGTDRSPSDLDLLVERHEEPNICDVWRAVVVLDADFVAVSGLVDLNTVRRKLYALDVEAAGQRGTDLAGRRVSAVELLPDVVEHLGQPHVLHVERNELEPAVAHDAKQGRENQKADDRDAGLTAARRDAGHSIPLPMRLHCGPPSLGERQFIQMRSARPTRRYSGMNSTPSKRLSRLLSRLSPMTK